MHEIMMQRAQLMNGYEPKLVIDVGGTGRYFLFENGVVDINIKSDKVPSTKLTFLQNFLFDLRPLITGNAFALALGDTYGLGKTEYSGFLLPNSVSKIYIERPGFGGFFGLGTNQNMPKLAQGIAKILKPGGEVSIWLESRATFDLKGNLHQTLVDFEDLLKAASNGKITRVQTLSKDMLPRTDGVNLTGTRFIFRRAQ